ncbi:Uncharacterised protein [Klebsiella pneumoniae]|nr:Uncharacterised protein [Klebsiella pneumoniae]
MFSRNDAAYSCTFSNMHIRHNSNMRIYKLQLCHFLELFNTFTIYVLSENFNGDTILCLFV